MITLVLRLEARAPARRCFRGYEVTAGQDLFGVWLVEMRYGRIGASGRTKARSYTSFDAAVSQVATCLRKRATAPVRIGAAYRLLHAAYDPAWRAVQLDQSLTPFAPADKWPVVSSMLAGGEDLAPQR